MNSLWADSQIKVLDDGKVMTKGAWVVSDIKITEEAKKYPAFVNTAFNNPNKGIIAKEMVTNTVVFSLFFGEKTIVHTIVKYTLDENLIDSEYRTHKSLVSLSFPVFWLMLLLARIFYEPLF